MRGLIYIKFRLVCCLCVSSIEQFYTVSWRSLQHGHSIISIFIGIDSYGYLV